MDIRTDTEIADDILNKVNQKKLTYPEIEIALNEMEKVYGHSISIRQRTRVEDLIINLQF